MKTRISQVAAAVIFAFILLAGNVNAKGTELIASGYENMEETKLEVENWMVSDFYWNKSDVVNYIVEVSDENMELESWMIALTSWEKQEVNFEENETDNVLTLENWMVNENIWN
jgi:hypothetical protein